MSGNNLQPLIGKIIITGTIEVITGLAIGGSKSGIDIGALDNPVIKTHKNVPYIPGSTLKGKLRALLAKVAGTANERADKALMNGSSEFKHLATVFGFAPENSDSTAGEALLKVRDSFVKGGKATTEEKMENSIDRIKGTANPRPLERVVPETVFILDLCLDVYSEELAMEHLKLLDLSFELLKQDYLGGGGTRGNGRVGIQAYIEKFWQIDTKTKKLVEGKFEFPFTNSIINESQDTEVKA